MKHSKLILVLFVLIVPATAMSGFAQGQRPMTLIDMLEVPQLGDPQLSPDGKQILFVLGRADWAANNRVSHIWRINADGTGMVQMTNGARSENGPRWSPDGSRVAFLSRRSSAEAEDAGAQIFLIANSGGEARQLSRHATAVSSIAWAPDGAAIYFLASDPKTAEEKERDKLRDDVFAFDENYKHTHIWKIAVADGKETKITSGDFSITGFDLSRDGARIVAARGRTPGMDYLPEPIAP